MCGTCKPDWGRCRLGWLSSAGLFSELPASGWPGAHFASHFTNLQTQAKINRPTDAKQRSVVKSPGRSKVNRPTQVRRSKALLYALLVMPGMSRDTGVDACTAPHPICRNAASTAMGAEHLMSDQCWVTHIIVDLKLMPKKCLQRKVFAHEMARQ